MYMHSLLAIPCWDPEAPKEWDSVNAMAQRSRSKLLALHERLADARKLARQRGVALISVSQEKSVVVEEPIQNTARMYN